MAVLVRWMRAERFSQGRRCTARHHAGRRASPFVCCRGERGTMSDHIEGAPSTMHPTVAQLVEEVRDLPMSMSETLPAVIEACDNAEPSANDLTGLISADQSLVAMLLKLANSAYYGYARRIETLPEA